MWAIIDFSVRLELESTPEGEEGARKALAGEVETTYAGEAMPLSDALAEWLLQMFPEEVASVSATVEVKPSFFDVPSGGGLGGGGQVAKQGKSKPQTARGVPRKAVRSGSAKPMSSSK